MPPISHIESGRWRFLVLVAACATLAGIVGCAKTKALTPTVDADTGEEAAAAGGQGGEGGAAGTTGAAGSSNPFDVPDADAGAETDADACGGDACGATDVVEQQAVCGDGKIGEGEDCDDSNMVGGDGCSSSCQFEAGFACPAPGEKCVSTVKCNDRKVTGNEQCDDGNNVAGDGCSPTCTLECGWTCTVGGGCRAALCGDGKLAGNEQCDDGNTTAGDGCSATCTLEGKPPAVAEGWACTSPKLASGCVGPTTCTTTVCGNKIKEGSEQCDDGNMVTGDGCTPFCRLEPVCPPGGGACATACGDGLLLPVDITNGQECDDGNTVDGDGCSAKCKKESGFNCTDVSSKPDTLILPVVYHDFKNWNETGGHVDFGHFQGNGKGFAGIVQQTLGPNGVPLHVAGCWPTPGAGYPALLTANGCTPGGVPAPGGPAWSTTTDWFGMWYVDDASNKTVVSTLTLLPPVAGGAAFQFNNDAFFPIDGMGWNVGIAGNNFNFTSVTRTWFEYTGVSTLTFVGDDDVWVFVNKKLAVDLGGTHQRSSGSITLDAMNGHGYSCDFVAPGNAFPSPVCDAVNNRTGHDVDLGLTMGSVYEIVVFQAERFPVESHYQLTLSGFTGIKSSCVGACGNGVVTGTEQCDLGAAKNTGAYGTCNADCTTAPECGDGKVQMPQEECDDGVNLTTYNTAKKCGPGCKWASHCGDGIVDGMFEQCDQGADNGKGYDFCAIDCKLGPRCGDGIVQTDAGEECDLTKNCSNHCKNIHLM